MCNPVRIFVFWLPMLSLLAVIVSEAEGATVRRMARGDDDGGDDGGGDEGGMGGLGGALASMMGGAGGGGGADDGGDDDANMVEGNKKQKAKGFDASGLESSLHNGGVGGLVGMLNAMRMANGKSDNHIVKGTNGEDMYDFRDIDSDFTTPKPINFNLDPVTMAPKAKDVTLVPMPSLPGVSLPGQHGQLKIQKSVSGRASSAPSNPMITAAAAMPVPVATLGVAASNVVPSFPAAAASSSFPAASASNLYEGLALVRQNMDMLMNQLSGGNSGTFAGVNGNAAPLESKIDQLSRSFAAEEQKLEGKVAALEGENEKMKEQVNEQADEINEMLGGKHPRASHHSNTSKAPVMKTQSKAHKAHKSKGSATHKAKSAALLWMKPGSYATKPWDVTFKVYLDGTAVGGEKSFTVRVHPEWAPEGAKRFQDMVREGILNNARFFRVIPRFMVQFGIPGSPKVAAKWMHKKIRDDPVIESNHYGKVSFAKGGRNSRTTQIFINTHNNDYLDEQGFAPFAEVLKPGMDVVEQFVSKYKSRPNQQRVWKEGNKYLTKKFPGLSTINHVDVTPDATTKAAGFLPKKK